MASPAIVVTDPDLDFLEMVREVLASEGYPTISCEPYATAWACILREAPGLVCITISLSEPDTGWTLLDKLRLHAPTATIPVILCATDTVVLTRKATHLERLNCSILEKPFLIDDLLALVAKLIGPPPEGKRTA